MTDDDALLTELAEAERTARAVPEGFLSAGRAAYAWRTVDAELAELTTAGSQGRELSDAMPGTRAEAATSQALTFEGRDLTLEVDITPDGLHGQVVPPQPGVIELQRRDGSVVSTPVDEVGWFTFATTPDGLFRLLLRPRDGASIVTEWARP